MKYSPYLRSHDIGYYTASSLYVMIFMELTPIIRHNRVHTTLLVTLLLEQKRTKDRRSCFLAL